MNVPSSLLVASTLALCDAAKEDVPETAALLRNPATFEFFSGDVVGDGELDAEVKVEEDPDKDNDEEVIAAVPGEEEGDCPT